MSCLLPIEIQSGYRHRKDLISKYTTTETTDGRISAILPRVSLHISTILQTSKKGLCESVLGVVIAVHLLIFSKGKGWKSSQSSFQHSWNMCTCPHAHKKNTSGQFTINPLTWIKAHTWVGFPYFATSIWESKGSTHLPSTPDLKKHWGPKLWAKNCQHGPSKKFRRNHLATQGG